MLKEQGEVLIKDGHEYRWGRDHSVTIRGNKWYQHNGRYGGCAIDFLKEFQGLSFIEAVGQLLDGCKKGELQYLVQDKTEEPILFCLPERNANMRRLYAYLTKSRCISSNVITEFVREDLMYEDDHHNIIFCAKDETGCIVNAQKKSTFSYGQSYRGTVAGSDMKYSFCHIGCDENLYVFEAPIDMLSYITMHQEDWKQHSYLALGGGSEHSLMQLIKTNTGLKNIYLGMDHDVGGIEIAERLCDKLEGTGCEVIRILPQHKDYNEDLMNLNGREVKPAVEHPGKKYLEDLHSEIIGMKGSFKEIMESYAASLYERHDSESYDTHLRMILSICIGNADTTIDAVCEEFRLYRNNKTIEAHDRQLQKVINEMKHQYYADESIQRDTYESLARECIGALVCRKMEKQEELKRCEEMEAGVITYE